MAVKLALNEPAKHCAYLAIYNEIDVHYVGYSCLFNLRY